MGHFRLSRFTRATGIAPMQLTERDDRVIRLVHRHRFLRSPQIAALLSDHSQQLLRRLQLLYHHGYLERPRAQIDYYRHGGSRHIVYGLGNKGAALLRREDDGSSALPRSGEKNRSLGRIFLEHALLVSDTMVALELACRESGNVRLLNQDELPLSMNQKSRPFQWKVTTNTRHKLGIIPDRVFALEYPDANGARTRAYFFLEADRGTMPVMRTNLTQTSFFRKLLAYEATWAQSLHRARFGFHRFRVLTITASPARVSSLVEACFELKRGHGLFLFADRTILENPAQMFSARWKSGRRGEVVRLLT